MTDPYKPTDADLEFAIEITLDNASWPIAADSSNRATAVAKIKAEIKAGNPTGYAEDARVVALAVAIIRREERAACAKIADIMRANAEKNARKHDPGSPPQYRYEARAGEARRIAIKIRQRGKAND